MSNNQSAGVQMPRYKCHKEVWALKIAAIHNAPPDSADGSMALKFERDNVYTPKTVSAEWLSKHKPLAGGYYVVYDDGYQSFSPAKAFEDGYTEI